MTGASQLPEPLAQGDLRRTPFAHVLLYVRKHALEGTLVVWQPDGGEERPKQDRILFDVGAPVAGRLLEPASRLERGMLPLFARTAGPYAFYEAIDLVGSGEGVRMGRVDVLPLIAASLRGSSRDDVVGQVCAGFGDSKLRLEMGVDLETFGFLPEERAFVDLLRAEPMSIARLVEISPLPPRMAERVVYLLAITKSIAPWEAAEPAGSPREEKPAAAVAAAKVAAPAAAAKAAPTVTPVPEPAGAKPAAASSPASTSGRFEKRERTASAAPPSGAARPPPPGLSSEHRALWEEIVERARLLDEENYFQMLGVPRDAPASAVQKAYFNLVKKWHPDRVPAPLAELRPLVEDVFRHLTRAQETLADESKRGPYLTSVQDGGGTPAAERHLAQIVQAAMEFRKVEVLLKRREHAEALRLIDEILAITDEEPDYHAARGWTLFQLHPNDTTMRAAALASIDRALALTEKHDKAHYYKGMILQRAGRASEAAAAFRRAAEINPKNIEAVRMVRIAGMRGEEPPPPADDAGGGGGKRESIFGKLFGGKKK